MGECIATSLSNLIQWVQNRFMSYLVLAKAKVENLNNIVYCSDVKDHQSQVMIKFMEIWIDAYCN